MSCSPSSGVSPTTDDDNGHADGHLDKLGTVSLSADADGPRRGRRSRLDGTSEPTSTPTEILTETQTTAGEGNGFTALVTGLAMLLAALIARQRSS